MTNTPGSPTVANGYVYAGSFDGYFYKLETPHNSDSSGTRAELHTLGHVGPVEGVTSLSSLTSANTGGTSTDLSWSANKVDTTNVEYKPTSDSTWETYSTLSGSTTTETLTGLKNGEAYDIRVVAESDSSVQSTTTVTTTLPPDDQPVLTSPEERQITVDRETVTTNYGSVEVQYRETGASTWTTHTTVPYDFTTIDITNLSDETEYEIRLQTQTEHTTASWTTPVTATTLTPTEPAAGTVVDQNGQPVSNATVTVYGVDREQLDVDPSQLDARAQEIRQELRNPDPPNFSLDRNLAASDGLFADASTAYVAAHPKGDWGLTAYQDAPQLGNPRVQLPAGEQIALSVWDPSAGGLVQDGVNSDLPGGIIDDTDIVVESIDHAGGTVDRQTIETDRTYDVGLIGGSHEFAVTTLPKGFYRVYPEGSPETAYVIVVGDPQSITSTIRADLQDEAGELTAQAAEAREYLEQDVLRKYKTTTNEQGEWAVDIPASVTRVSVQAHKAPPGLNQDPQNVSLQDVREFYAVSEYNGSYVMPADAGTYSVPDSDIRVEVVETEAPQFADLGRYQNATESFRSLLGNLSYSDLPSSIQQRLSDLDRDRLEETAEELQQLANENAQLEARVEELMERDFSAIQINDSSDAELRQQIQAQQQAISELRATIEATETTTSINESVASSTATFAQDLSAKQVRVVANFPNGTSREVPDEYLTLDQSAATIVGQGGTQIAVEDYPLGDASGVTFDYVVVTPNGIGETTTKALKPGAGSIGLDAVSLSSLRPGPAEQVDITLIGDDETQVTNITNARAVGPNGEELNTSVDGTDTATFQTVGVGRHYVEVTFTTASGEQGTLTHRIAAGETDQAMPPGIRIKDTPFGTLAVVGDGFEAGSVDVRNGGSTIDVTGQIGADQDTPARMHLYAHSTDLPPTATLSVNIVRGAEQRAVQRHVEVTAHLPAIASENPTLYRGEEALPREGDGDLASVTTTADEMTIITVTDARGSLQLQTNSDPGLNERVSWWIDRNTPEFSLGVLGQLPLPPTLPLVVSGAVGWVGPVQAAAPALTIDMTVAVPFEVPA